MIGAGTKKCGEKLKGRGGAERKKSMPLLLTTQVYKKKIKKAQLELTEASDDANNIDIILKEIKHMKFNGWITFYNKICFSYLRQKEGTLCQNFKQ